MLKAGDGARRDPGAAFEVLGRNARERNPAYPVAGVLPGLPRHREHRRLPGSGIADHDAEVAPVSDMGEGEALLPRQDETLRFRPLQGLPGACSADAVALRSAMIFAAP